MNRIQIRFVEVIPPELDDGLLYISMNLHTASHKCFCGCGKRIVTPLSPVGWQLSFDGKTVSLNPSISNSGCQSHYWIIKSEVISSPRLTKAEALEGRRKDVQDTEDYFSGKIKYDRKKRPPFKTRFSEFWAAAKQLF